MITGLLFILTFCSLVSLNFSDPGILHRGEDWAPWQKEVAPRRSSNCFRRVGYTEKPVGLSKPCSLCSLSPLHKTSGATTV